MKINHFRGDITDDSAKTKPLIEIPANSIGSISVRFFESSFIESFFGILRSRKYIFLIKELNHFRGDITDVSAKTKPLMQSAGQCRCFSRCTGQVILTILYVQE